MANTSLTIASLPTLPTSSATFLVAGWVRSLHIGQQFFLLNDTGLAGLSIEVADTSSSQSGWSVSGKDTTGAAVFSTVILPAISIDLLWTSFAISGNTTAETLQIMVNTVLLAPSVTWATNNNIGFHPTTDSWEVGPTMNAGTGIVMSDFRFGAGEGFFDLSMPTNVAKLFAAGNQPVGWGADGSVPTGQQPAVFLHGDMTTYANNLGSGGSFTVSGPALVDYTPGP